MRYLFFFFTSIILFSHVTFASKLTIPQVCLVSKVSASSYLFESKYPKLSYHPVNLLDNNINTAWFEGRKGDGIGEFVEFEFFT